MLCFCLQCFDQQTLLYAEMYLEIHILPICAWKCTPLGFLNHKFVYYLCNDAHNLCHIVRSVSQIGTSCTHLKETGLNWQQLAIMIQVCISQVSTLVSDGIVHPENFSPNNLSGIMI